MINNCDIIFSVLDFEFCVLQVCVCVFGLVKRNTGHAHGKGRQRHEQNSGWWRGGTS